MNLAVGEHIFPSLVPAESNLLLEIARLHLISDPPELGLWSFGLRYPIHRQDYSTVPIRSVPCQWVLANNGVERLSRLVYFFDRRRYQHQAIQNSQGLPHSSLAKLRHRHRKGFGPSLMRKSTDSP